MSDKKKKPPTESQTFWREPEADLRPPKPKASSADDQREASFGRREPVFTLDLEGPLESSIKKATIDTNVVSQEINALHSQVQDINRLKAADEISQDQVDVLRKYIALKEAESQDLKEQQKQYQTYVRKLTGQVATLTARVQDLVSELESLKARNDSSRDGSRDLEKQHQEEIIRLKNEYEDQIRRSGNVSAEYKELQRRREEWKDKVKEDLKRIKLKERELENKYELLKRDTQVLLDSKDKHVIELKRKNDALELEMESLEDRLRQSSQSVSAVGAKKRRLIETLRLAISLLEEMDNLPSSDADSSKKAG